MSDELDTPQWRQPPTRVGPIEDDSALVDVLERNAGAIAIALAVTILILAAYLWGVDWLAGHR